MATLPAVKLEMLINGSWVDMAATPARLDGATPQSRVLWSESGGPVQIVRGVADDGGTATGTFDCVLENNDGALTPEKATSPYYPYLTKGRQIRFSSYFGGSWHQRFGGYVWGEPVRWTNEVGTACNIAVSAIDAIGMAFNPLRSVAVEATAARNPIAYWPLTDSETTAAADQSHNDRPPLNVSQPGTDGDISWASGAVLPTDNVGGIVFANGTKRNGDLRTSVGFDLPSSWTATFIATPSTTKDGYLFQIGTDSYSIGVWWDSSAKKLNAIETKLDSSGDPIDYVLATSSIAWPVGNMDFVTVTPTTVTLGSGGSGSRHSSATMLDSRIAVGGAFAVESGRSAMYDGEIKHLALWSGASSPASLDTDTLTGPTAMFLMSTAVAQVMAWAGFPVSVSTLGTDHAVQLVKTEGVSGADLLSQYARGSAARIFCGGDGNIVIAALDYFSSPVTAPSGDIDPGIEWAADADGAVSGAKMTYPDGAVYQVGTGELDLPGVLSTREGKEVTDWRVGSGAGMPRFPDASYHLLTMSDAEAAALAVLDIAYTLVIPGLPTQLPAASQSGLVDAMVETYGADVWDLEPTTSPDPRDELLIIGDATRGRVTAGYLAAPLGPLVDDNNSSWHTGDEITHTHLNASAWTGPEIQVGMLTITPTANTISSLAVTFPTAFASTPTVVVTEGAGSDGAEVQEVSMSGISTTGFTFYIYRTTATLTYFSWVGVA